MNDQGMKSAGIFSIVVIITPALSACCDGTSIFTQTATNQAGGGDSAFGFDANAFPDAKPWTSEDFKNDPKIPISRSPAAEASR